ncbi:unnamed protein product [Didymodactylos carnosus]|uniref:Myeloid leukemia factor n=1 Tax=Didymodactylos carnosus TaxID=1234261 RepID=A0A813QXL1_9BILA|nr:unnamed protein product [Didymodactylos carnosus]CAF0794656.1 unnamed protein product [Didymodactylos carnosus]CAF3554769.1 unnamed protein product [Didymodactylos carnosus]CAF3577543.1 unnamed protein product [Didymodactylos carnosus]
MFFPDLFGRNRSGNPNNAMNPLFSSHSLALQPFIPHNPFGGDLLGEFSSSPFSLMDAMMGNMRSVMDPPRLFHPTPSISDTNAPIHSFTSTTVMSYGAGPDGRPKVYQESTSRSRGPGGIEETRQAVRDSERGINKMHVGRRIGDRKHVIERELNAETGQISENVELENLDEEETEGFKNEWRQRSGGLRQPTMALINHRQPPPLLAIEDVSSAPRNRKNQQRKQTVSTSPLPPPPPPREFHRSDTIDLTDVPDSPLPNDDDNNRPHQKRKASHYPQQDRKHRDRNNRF